MEQAASNKSKTNGAGNLMKKGGLAVFLFFLIKGIGWLVLFGLVAFGLMDETTVQKIKTALPF